MARTVGVPHGLLFYRYYPMWKAFFEALDHEVVPSHPTSKRTVRLGTRLGDNELCLPVKVFFGQCYELDGEVDVIFVPRVVAVEKKRYTCPKLLGLPDMVRSLELETPLLSPTIDLRKGRRQFRRDVEAFAAELGASRREASSAVRTAMQALDAHEERMRAGKHLVLPEPKDGRSSGMTVGVAGHPYIIYDNQISLDLIRRLAERGIEVLVPETVTHAEVDRALRDIPKDVFWTYERDVIGSLKHWIDNDMVDGIIYVMSFACGPDSFMHTVVGDSVRDQAGERTAALMTLVVDEHSGEAGMVTRLEAFLDMLERRKAVVPA
jgi:predicted nucleotide-binding protein (sugar kinase/HSP70/actin superfamily)